MINFCSDFWDSSPFAINLAYAAGGIVFSDKLDLSKTVFSILDSFDKGDPSIPPSKLQKVLCISGPSRRGIFLSWIVLLKSPLNNFP